MNRSESWNKIARELIAYRASLKRLRPNSHPQMALVSRSAHLSLVDPGLCSFPPQISWLPVKEDSDHEIERPRPRLINGHRS